ncbi:MAG: hypothetical protein N2578_10205 [Bdellovibrionaceae bacterium]|nr:hypothetical protein [Pseudobdellovibrionaceae bacterium]
MAWVLFRSGGRGENLPTTLRPDAPFTISDKYKNIDFAALEQKSKSYSRSEVRFLYNGHDWEAHEVLGVARGSSLEDITTRYQQLVVTCDPGKIEFYEAAMNALLSRKN